MTVVVLLSRLLLSGVFVVAGVAKLFDRDGSQTSQREFGVPAVLVPAFVWLLPIAELASAALLLIPATAWWGAAGATTLLAAFTLAIGVSLLRGRKPACHCFGQLSNEPAGASTLVRNVVLLGVSVFVLWRPASGPTIDPGQPGSSVSPLALALIVETACGAVALFHLLRQNGRLMLRLEAVEAKLGIAPTEEPIETGLAVGTEAPTFELQRLDGGRLSLAQLGSAATPLLLVFSEPECGACEALLPDVASWQNAHGALLRVVLVTRGSVAENLNKVGALRIPSVVLQKSREVADAYGVVGTPSAVVVENGRIASPLAAGATAIRDLVEQAIKPKPLARGERVPSMSLRVLDGGAMDLASLIGERTVLLFWNPSCGFCQQMLEDVRASEREKADRAPRLVIVSAGSPKANREQGFRSTVLLDPTFGASERFGVSGTPGAVLVDDKGRVASSPEVGAPAVLALIGADASLPATA